MLGAFAFHVTFKFNFNLQYRDREINRWHIVMQFITYGFRKRRTDRYGRSQCQINKPFHGEKTPSITPDMIQDQLPGLEIGATGFNNTSV